MSKFRSHVSVLLVAVGVTLLIRFGYYFANQPLNGAESLFLLLVICVAVLAVRGVATALNGKFRKK